MFFNKNFWYAAALLVGTIIGAGMFGLPYAIEKAGFLPGIFLLILLTLLMLYSNLMYGEIVLRTPGRRRYSGLVAQYFSSKMKSFVTFYNTLSHLGALLAYLILGGILLNNILSFYLPVSPALCTLIFFGLASIGVIFGFELFGKINLLLVGALVAMILIISCWGLPAISGSNLLKTDWRSIFFPYGPILFAIGGGCAIPEMVEVLRRKSCLTKRALIIGNIIPLIIACLFIFSAIGIAGGAITVDAISSLGNYLGRPAVIFGSFIGLLAIITSFFTVGLNLKKILWYDYKVNPHLAASFVLLIPLGLFFIGVRDFIEVISLIGIFFVGIDGVVMMKLFYRARQKGKKRVSYRLPFAKFMPYVIAGIFILGVILELYFRIT